MKSHEYLIQKIHNLAQLRKLKSEVDPASGMTVRVRRGPMSQDEGDRPREWIEIETGIEMDTIIDGLIRCEIDSIKFWRRVATGDADHIKTALEMAAKIEHYLTASPPPDSLSS